MIADLHFLRPWWFLAIIPLILFLVVLWRQKTVLQAWANICDSALLDHLIQRRGKGGRTLSLLCLYFSGLFMILALAGPCWIKLPVPTYKPILPRVLLLDMSTPMQETDLSPNRLERAKFKLHDLFAHKGVGQFGLIAYTSEPFVVSPLTDDGQTIVALLPMLRFDIMPVGGHNLAYALEEAKKILNQAGYTFGQILVLTASAPNQEALRQASELASEHIDSSIMPITANRKINVKYNEFAHAGHGQVVPYEANNSDLDQWLKMRSAQDELALNNGDDIPLWKDEGRWLLIPALVFLLPVFRRGLMQKVMG